MSEINICRERDQGHIDTKNRLNETNPDLTKLIRDKLIAQRRELKEAIIKGDKHQETAKQ